MSTPPPPELPEGSGAGHDGPLETAILFVDLINSSDFASVLGLREYAAYVDSFEDLCRRQCAYYFETFLQGKYRRGTDYDWNFRGDELVVFAHTGKAANDVYQLVCLAIALKCGWLGVPLNLQRIAAGVPAADLAAGIHSGPVWATRRGDGYALRGSAVNVAKRVETESRNGDCFRLFVSDAAYKRIGRKVRNLLFSPRRVSAMKGVVLPVAVREVHDCFLDMSERIRPDSGAAFRAAAPEALGSATFDLWIHSCLQVWEQKVNGRVTDRCLDLCRHVLNMEPRNAVALYHAAQGVRERGDLETARLYLNDLTRYFPHFGDGWLEFGRLLKLGGDVGAARHAILEAHRHGVDPAEEALPNAD